MWGRPAPPSARRAVLAAGGRCAAPPPLSRVRPTPSRTFLSAAGADAARRDGASFPALAAHVLSGGAPDPEALQALVACCHTRAQLDALLQAHAHLRRAAGVRLSSWEVRLLLTAAARFGAAPEASALVRAALADADDPAALWADMGRVLVRGAATPAELRASLALFAGGSGATATAAALAYDAVDRGNDEGGGGEGEALNGGAPFAGGVGDEVWALAALCLRHGNDGVGGAVLREWWEGQQQATPEAARAAADTLGAFLRRAIVSPALAACAAADETAAAGPAPKPTVLASLLRAVGVGRGGRDALGRRVLDGEHALVAWHEQASGEGAAVPPPPPAGPTFRPCAVTMLAAVPHERVLGAAFEGALLAPPPAPRLHALRLHAVASAAALRGSTPPPDSGAPSVAALLAAHARRLTAIAGSGSSAANDTVTSASLLPLGQQHAEALLRAACAGMLARVHHGLHPEGGESLGCDDAVADAEGVVGVWRAAAAAGLVIGAATEVAVLASVAAALRFAAAAPSGGGSLPAARGVVDGLLGLWEEAPREAGGSAPLDAATAQLLACLQAVTTDAAASHAVDAQQHEYSAYLRRALVRVQAALARGSAVDERKEAGVGVAAAAAQQDGEEPASRLVLRSTFGDASAAVMQGVAAGAEVEWPSLARTTGDAPPAHHSTTPFLGPGWGVAAFPPLYADVPAPPYLSEGPDTYDPWAFTRVLDRDSSRTARATEARATETVRARLRERGGFLTGRLPPWAPHAPAAAQYQLAADALLHDALRLQAAVAAGAPASARLPLPAGSLASPRAGVDWLLERALAALAGRGAPLASGAAEGSGDSAALLAAGASPAVFLLNCCLIAGTPSAAALSQPWLLRVARWESAACEAAVRQRDDGVAAPPAGVGDTTTVVLWLQAAAAATAQRELALPPEGALSLAQRAASVAAHGLLPDAAAAAGMRALLAGCYAAARNAVATGAPPAMVALGGGGGSSSDGGAVLTASGALASDRSSEAGWGWDAALGAPASSVAMHFRSLALEPDEAGGAATGRGVFLPPAVVREHWTLRSMLLLGRRVGVEPQLLLACHPTASRKARDTVARADTVGLSHALGLPPTLPAAAAHVMPLDAQDAAFADDVVAALLDARQLPAALGLHWAACAAAPAPSPSLGVSGATLVALFRACCHAGLAADASQLFGQLLARVDAGEDVPGAVRPYPAAAPPLLLSSPPHLLPPAEWYALLMRCHARVIHDLAALAGRLRLSIRAGFVRSALAAEGMDSGGSGRGNRWGGGAGSGGGRDEGASAATWAARNVGGNGGHGRPDAVPHYEGLGEALAGFGAQYSGGGSLAAGAHGAVVAEATPLRLPPAGGMFALCRRLSSPSRAAGGDGDAPPSLAVGVSVWPRGATALVLVERCDARADGAPASALPPGAAPRPTFRVAGWPADVLDAELGAGAATDRGETTAGRRRTSLLAGLFQFGSGGRVGAEWHVQGRHCLDPHVFALSPTGALVSAYLRAASDGRPYAGAADAGAAVLSSAAQSPGDARRALLAGWRLRRAALELAGDCALDVQLLLQHYAESRAAAAPAGAPAPPLPVELRVAMVEVARATGSPEAAVHAYVASAAERPAAGAAHRAARGGMGLPDDAAAWGAASPPPGNDGDDGGVTPELADAVIQATCAAVPSDHSHALNWLVYDAQPAQLRALAERRSAPQRGGGAPAGDGPGGRLQPGELLRAERVLLALDVFLRSMEEEGEGQGEGQGEAVGDGASAGGGAARLVEEGAPLFGGGGGQVPMPRVAVAAAAQPLPRSRLESEAAALARRAALPAAPSALLPRGGTAAGAAAAAVVLPTSSPSLQALQALAVRAARDNPAHWLGVAMHVYRDSVGAHGVTPLPSTYVALLAACGRRSNPSAMTELYRGMRGTGVLPLAAGAGAAGAGGGGGPPHQVQPHAQQQAVQHTGVAAGRLA